MREFQELDRFHIKDRGMEIVVKNPGGFYNPSVLCGEVVRISGKTYKVKGVETFRPALPYRDSLNFGLLVEEVE